MSKNEVLIVKSDYNDFERYYNENIRMHDVVVLDKKVLGINRRLNHAIIRQIQYGWKMVISGWVKKLKEFGTIIVFDSAGSFLPWISFFSSRKSRIIIWQWNKKNTLPSGLRKLLYRRCEIWTFDEGDAREYGWNYNNQFYFEIDTNNRSIENEENNAAFFVGQDKGRYEELCQIQKELHKYGIQPEFCLVKETGKEYCKSHTWVKETGLTYNQVINHVKNCKYVLELVQEGQSGLTVRFLEAVFYQKKIITNNINSINSELYRKNNVFIVGKDSWESFGLFESSPYEKIPENIMRKYTFNKWLDNFM